MPTSEFSLSVFGQMLEVMENAFRDFEAALPKAQRIQQRDGWVYRFKSQDIHHAVVIKLALIQSTLRAALILLQHGYVAQQAMLHRVIDEANEDILFLVFSVTNNAHTPLHDRYLAAFWAEEFRDPEAVIESHQSREMVPRQKIRAYLAQIGGGEFSASRSVDVTKVLSKVYSGFVHGAAPHILESYGGSPPHFHLRGMLGTPRIREYTCDLWNYMYRGFVSHIFVAKVFGSGSHVDELTKEKERFEALMGKSY